MAHHGAALRLEIKDAKLAEAIARNWRVATVPSRWHALFEYAEAATKSPSSMSRDNIERLRGAGLSDREIVDLTCVVAYFNYVNRLAEALGVELENSE